MRGPALVLLFTLSSAAGVTGGLIGGLAILKPDRLQLPVRNQDMNIVIKDPMGMHAEVLDPVEVDIADTIHARVPVNQTLQLPVADTLNVVAHFDSPVRIRMDVPVKHQLHLDQAIPLNTVVETEFLGVRQRLPIRGLIPIKADVPISLTIPIDQDMPLKFDAPMAIKFDQVLNVPLQTEFEADIPIRGRLSMPVIGPLDTRVVIDPTPVLIEVQSADIDLPIDALRLLRDRP
ncbi:hypothetical protein E4T66_19945 [Sinimarinibacterium sp. CAU 1509]|uniref:hypothetical protein n=1 Tax=Sinimarinibacterium sp. CAU 1509 TaxID=2562283 RepID=UPI0010ACEC00|nr:hypothetical protein [Sinimarinibacterium sp. CAU 1509]TJY56235.1 hypothetical protein E4T66_19945 [Sinimarinibacterium sp. CAU 1509]